MYGSGTFTMEYSGVAVECLEWLEQAGEGGGGGAGYPGES